ncbi:MAG: glycosyltransferase [Flavobacterium sp.]
MRILQLIDSLQAGGAERMAVNYANALSEVVEYSAIVCTREVGPLRAEIVEKVDFYFLAKTKALDLQALTSLKKICLDNNVDTVHAHSTSYFLAVLLKFALPKISIIWHNHNGLSQNLPRFKILMIKSLGKFFKGTIVVNLDLLRWTEKTLNLSNVIYLENFAVKSNCESSVTKLFGTEEIKIICVANLRPEKNHALLINVAEKITRDNHNCSFHIVGKDFKDNYSREIKNIVKEKKMNQKVFFYGSQNNIPGLLKQAQIGILTSNLEGLPVALLEYGMCGLSVVSTSVGAVPEIINENMYGFLVKPDNVNEFSDALEKLILSPELREELGYNLKAKITYQYSKDVVIDKYLNWISLC